MLRWLIGAATSAVLSLGPAAAQSLIRDAEIEEMARAYSDPIFAAAGLKPEDVEILLVADPSINAFVAGGQNMFLHTGLIYEAESPNQLKGVIAHETAHIALGHLVRQREGVRQATAPMILTMALGAVAAAAGEGGAAIALLSSASQFGALSFFGYVREQEENADLKALQYLDEVGQSPLGLQEFFEKLYQQNYFLAKLESQAKYYQTHPLTLERVDRMREAVEVSAHNDLAEDAIEVEMLNRAKAKISGFLDRPEVVSRRYPETDTSIYARYARAVARYRVGEIDLAVGEVDGLLAMEPENPYFHELRGQILFEAGRAEAAIPSYRQALALKPDHPLLLIGLAQALIGAKDTTGNEEALRLLRRALVQEPGNPLAWNQESRAYYELGDTAMAELATAEQHYSVGNAVEAKLFAGRACKNLTRGTPAWVRADEIFAIYGAVAAGPGGARANENPCRS